MSVKAATKESSAVCSALRPDMVCDGSDSDSDSGEVISIVRCQL